MLRIKVVSFLLLSALAILAVLFTQTDHKLVFINEAQAPTIVEKIAQTIERVIDPNVDIDPQAPLAQRPKVIKAIYSTAWSAGNEKKVNYFLDLLNATELNAIVIDIKDYTGVVSYLTEIETVEKYGASEKRIAKINVLIKRLHDAGIYAIARISVFQDTKLAYARSDLALISSSTGAVWTDRKKVAWVDPASKEVWDYNLSIAKDALARGFDEVNFDYIRFASDGDIDDIKYPFFDANTLKAATMKKFFEYLRANLPKSRVSADLFGLTTINTDDLGIGQKIEDAFANFDYVAPMTYPSHYAAGFNGIANPAAAPYEIMKYSIDHALARLTTHIAKSTNIASSTASSTPTSKLRPWLQDFDLGADYTPEMVRAQIKAIEDSARIYSGCASLTFASSTSDAVSQQPCSALVDGWMLWNPANVYTREALLAE